jgi:hypothetical protein
MAASRDFERLVNREPIFVELDKSRHGHQVILRESSWATDQKDQR